MLSIEAFVRRLGEERATAILRTDERELARSAMRAAVRGGFRIVEFTLTVPGAFELIEEFAGEPELIVGAGTVLTVEEARESVRRGASFLVSPVTDESVITAANALGVASIPGGHTPTELLRAQRAGAPLQKLFPAPAGGPAYVRACLGPLPALRIVPTSGVDEHNAAEFLAAGAFAVGFVAPLFRPELLAARDFGALEAHARRLRSIVDAAPRLPRAQ